MIAQNTLSTVTRLIDRIEQTDGYVAGETEVLFIGRLDKSILNMGRSYMVNDGIGLYYNFSATYNLEKYIKEYLGCRMLFLDDSEKIDEIKQREEIWNMEAFPSSDCIRIIDRVVVVRLSWD